ncbi:MAG: hypothetical protein HRT87_05435 [Legionellales bacterium]|nr:hypothetical protein [Legionellales bacterium]
MGFVSLVVSDGVINCIEHLMRECIGVEISVTGSTVFNAFECGFGFASFAVATFYSQFLNLELVNRKRALFATKVRRVFYFYLLSGVVVNLFFLFLLKILDGYIVEIVNILAWIFDVSATSPFYEGIGVDLRDALLWSSFWLYAIFLCLGTSKILGEFGWFFNIKYIFKKFWGDIKQIRNWGKNG